MANLSIRVRLNPDRSKGGEIELIDAASGKRLWGPRPALGKAAENTAAAKGNSGADPLKPFGDTPTGTYGVTLIRSTADLEQRSYGPNGALVLDPTGGQALVAEGNGRTGLWIHGGDVGPNGGLRRTNGCVRLFNQDMKELVAAIIRNSVKASDSSVQVLSGSVTVRPDDGGDDVEVGDPPPTHPGPIILP